MQIDYTIGDDIVCVKKHSQDLVKIGEVFKCYGLRKGYCDCSEYLVSIGHNDMQYEFCCDIHNCTLGVTNSLWVGSHLFRKLDTLVNIDEIHELLNEPVENLFNI